MNYDREKLRAELELDEGRRTKAYTDSLGIWTIGVGWNLLANEIPKDVVDRLLEVSIIDAENALDRLEPRWREIDSDRQRVLLNMAFNLGQTRFGLFKKFWASVRDYLDTHDPAALDRGAAEMENSDWWHQVGERAVRLRDQWRATVPPTEE